MLVRTLVAVATLAVLGGCAGKPPPKPKFAYDIVITTEPTPATVYIEGKEEGQSPVKLHLEVDHPLFNRTVVAISARADGYDEKRQSVDFTGNRTYHLKLDKPGSSAATANTGAPSGPSKPTCNYCGNKMPVDATSCNMCGMSK